MDNTIQDLTRIKTRLEATLRSCQSELDAINKAIELVEREHGGGGRPTLASPAAPGTPKGRDLSKITLTEACRLSVVNEFRTPAEVRDAMLVGGFPLPTKGRTRLLNYVFVTLKRLSKSGEFERGQKDGKFAVRRPQRSTTEFGEMPNLPLN